MKTQLSAISNGIVALTSAALLVFGASALAHEGHDHGSGEEKVKGTIKSLTDKSMVITSTDGKDITLDVMDMTKFERNGKPTTAADVSVGEKAVVTTMKEGESSAHAMLVKLGKKPRTKGQGTTKSTADGGAAVDGGIKKASPTDTTKHEDQKHDGH